MNKPACFGISDPTDMKTLARRGIEWTADTGAIAGTHGARKLGKFTPAPFE
jgi:hypothetical protein